MHKELKGNLVRCFIHDGWPIFQNLPGSRDLMVCRGLIVMNDLKVIQK